MNWMRSVCEVIFIGIGAGLMTAGVGCVGSEAGSPSADPSSLLAEVERMEVPDRVASSDTLTVRLVGTVGPNGCYSLDRLDVERGVEQIQIRPLVDRVHRRDAMCTMAIVPLDETLRLSPPFSADTLSILVPQSEGAAVTATVPVERE